MSLNARTGTQEHGCQKCAKNYPMPYEEFLSRMILKYGKNLLFPETFTGFKLQESIITLSCHIHGRFEKQARLLLKSGCKTCNKNIKSKLCLEIEKWLKLYNIKFICEKTFDDLKYIGSLYYDYYIENWGLKIVIEADGSQHFNYTGWDNKDSESLELRFNRDIIKDQYAIDNNICLIRIPYNMLDNVKNILLYMIVYEDSLGHYICTYSHNNNRLKLSNNVLLLLVPSPSVNYNLLNYSKDEESENDE